MKYREAESAKLLVIAGWVMPIVFAAPVEGAGPSDGDGMLEAGIEYIHSLSCIRCTGNEWKRR